MNALCTANKTHRGTAVTKAVERAVSGGEHGGMIGESQVVVGTQVDDLGPAGDLNDGALWRVQHAFGLESARRASLQQALTELRRDRIDRPSRMWQGWCTVAETRTLSCVRGIVDGTGRARRFGALRCTRARLPVQRRWTCAMVMSQCRL